MLHDLFAFCWRIDMDQKEEKRPETDEKFWEVLMSADKKDYESICAQYGVTDFRGMLKKLNEKKLEREQEQEKVFSLTVNIKHNVLTTVRLEKMLTSQYQCFSISDNRLLRDYATWSPLKWKMMVVQSLNLKCHLKTLAAKSSFTRWQIGFKSVFFPTTITW